jgi:hypothetical protein
MEVDGQRHASATLPPRKTRYLWYWRLCRPHGRSGRVEKILPRAGFDPRTFQPVASRYSDCAIRVHGNPLVRTESEVVWTSETVWSFQRNHNHWGSNHDSSFRRRTHRGNESVTVCLCVGMSKSQSNWKTR